MKKNRAILAIFFFLLICALSGAHKIRYGGELRIRLNEPDTLRLSPTSYSNLLFYSLLYENFFFSVPGKEISSHLFKQFSYDEKTLCLTLVLHKGLAFSDGKPVLSRHVKNSLSSFFSRVIYRSKKLAGKVKNIVVKADDILEIHLVSTDPTIVADLTAPELVLIGDEETAFSGPFYPKGWDKGEKIELIVNPYYSGGRHPIDKVTVFFQNNDYLDIFLAEHDFSSPSYTAYTSGLYENTYLTFPSTANSGQNKRLALFALCKNIKGLSGFKSLDVLTSVEESPVSLAIKPLPDRKVVQILRNAKQIIYLASSLVLIEDFLIERFRRLAIPLEIRRISDNELTGYIQKNPVPVLIMKKLFKKETPMAEKLASLIREFSFNRFDEQSLGMIKQLEELSSLDRDDIVVPAMVSIIEKLVEDGVILPLFQQRFQLMVKQEFVPVVIDFYGRILWSELRHEKR